MKTLLDQLIGNDKGIGDTVERGIKKITRGKVKSCGGCQKRKDFLNEYFPYGKSKP